MEPKITLYSRDKKKKVLIQSTVSSFPAGQEDPPAQKNDETKITKNEKSSDEIYWQSPSYPPASRKKKKGKQEILSILLSIIGAIMVGVIMGVSILSIFFTNDSTYSKNSIDSHLYLPKTEDSKALKQPFSVYLLQAGSFQHRAGAEEKIRAYRKQGFAAVISAKAPYRIYLGLSFDQKGAFQLAKKYQEKGIDVYVKEHSISFPTKKGSSLSSIFDRSRPIVKELSRLSIDGIVKGGTIHFRPQIEKEYQQMLEEAKRRKGVLSKGEKDQLVKLLQALDLAVQSASEAKRNPSQALMWQIQEGLVRYIINIES